ASTAPTLPTPSAATQTLHLTTRLVQTYLSVRYKSGYVLNLTPADCRVLDDHTPQTIKTLTQEKNLPLTIGILLDTSGSQQRVLPLEQQSAIRFLKDVLTPPAGSRDLAFLITFDVNVDLQADLTNSLPELTTAIDHATINAASASVGLPGLGGGPFPVTHPRGTLLYDAVYLAAHDKLAPQAGRKVLILLTDGVDEGSQETLRSATEAAQRSNAILYVIFLTDHPFANNFSDPYSGKSAMQHLARATGGRVIDVGNNAAKLQSAFTQIQTELRTQYLLTYTPTTPADSKFHPLDITCGPDHTIQSRKGYYALPTDESNVN
ncbi:MAG: VWA domain-containing protein, partial [Acidobacteriaceae bacterium]